VLAIARSALAFSLLIVAAAPSWAHGPRGAGSIAAPAEASIEMAVASPAPPRPPDAAARLERGASGAPRNRSAADLAAATGLAIAALGLAGSARAWHRDRRVALATLSAGLLLGFIVETAPHLAHHALDPDKGAGCQVLQAAERSHAAIPALDVTPAPALAILGAVPSTVFVPALAAPRPCERAPPA
jgi:hypothetical protein